MNAREMIDRYTNEVARQLPPRARDDIRRELDSLLAEALERQAEKAGREPDEAMVAAMLKEFGSPAEMAAQYRGDEYLIGPVLFPTFKTVVTIALTVLATVQLVIFGAQALFGNTPLTIASLWEFLSTMISSALTAFVIIVFVFAVMERVPGNQLPEKEAWDPRSLPPVKDPNRIAPVDLVLGIVFPLLAIILFNRYAYWIVDIDVPEGGYHFFPLLHENFLNFVPWLTVSWGLEIVLRSLVLAQGRWNVITRVAQFLVELFSIYVAYLIFTGGPITFNSGIDSLVRFGLGIAIVVGLISAVVTLVKSLLVRSGDTNIAPRVA
ncbi:MAG: hypothetical protein GX579_02300 [Chloroflexi bacterium]|nr:hypothetical protein [Chloroflexota bacterium]